MARLYLPALFFAMLGSLADCSVRDNRVDNAERMLAAAGFHVASPTGPGPQQALSTLPPNQVVHSPDGADLYFYSDPVTCRCVYIGDGVAYGRYREALVQQHLSDEQGLPRPPVYERAR